VTEEAAPVTPGAEIAVALAVAPGVPDVAEAGAAAAVDDPCFFFDLCPGVAGFVVDAVADGVAAGGGVSVSALALLPLAFLLFGGVEAEAVLDDVVSDVLSVEVDAVAAPVADVPLAAVVLAA